MSSGVRTGAKNFRSKTKRMVNGVNKRKLLIIGAVVCLLIVGLGLTFWKLGAKKPSSGDTSSEALDSSVQGDVSSPEEGATTDPQTGDPVTEPGDVTSGEPGSESTIPADTSKQESATSSSTTNKGSETTSKTTIQGESSSSEGTKAPSEPKTTDSQNAGEPEGSKSNDTKPSESGTKMTVETEEGEIIIDEPTSPGTSDNGGNGGNGDNGGGKDADPTSSTQPDDGSGSKIPSGDDKGTSENESGKQEGGSSSGTTSSEPNEVGNQTSPTEEPPTTTRKLYRGDLAGEEDTNI